MIAFLLFSENHHGARCPQCHNDDNFKCSDHQNEEVQVYILNFKL